MVSSEWQGIYGPDPPTREGTGLFSLTHCGGCGAELIEGLDPESDFILCDDCEPMLIIEDGVMSVEWSSKSAWAWSCLHHHGAHQCCSDCIRRWISNIPAVPEHGYERRHGKGTL